jgi:hypothetical protein
MHYFYTIFRRPRIRGPGAVRISRAGLSCFSFSNFPMPVKQDNSSCNFVPGKEKIIKPILVVTEKENKNLAVNSGTYLHKKPDRRAAESIIYLHYTEFYIKKGRWVQARLPFRVNLL